MAIKIDNTENKIEKVEDDLGIVEGDLNINGKLTVKGQEVLVQSSGSGDTLTTIPGNVEIVEIKNEDSSYEVYTVGYNYNGSTLDYNWTKDINSALIHEGSLRGVRTEVGTNEYRLRITYTKKMQVLLKGEWEDRTSYDIAEGDYATFRLYYDTYSYGDLTVEGKTNIGGTLTVGGETIIKGDTEIKGKLTTTESINGVNWHWEEFTFDDDVNIVYQKVYKTTNTPGCWFIGNATMAVHRGTSTSDVTIEFDAGYVTTVTGSDGYQYTIAINRDQLTITHDTGSIEGITGEFKILTFK